MGTEQKIFVTEKADKKCGGCNYAVTQFYGIGDTLESARKDFNDTADEEYGAGLCGYCMVDLLVDEGYSITQDKKIADLKNKAKDIKILKFKCEKCGCETLEEVMLDVVMYSTIKNINKKGDESSLEYDSNIETLDGEIDRYRCKYCKKIITDKAGDTIDTLDGLIEWLETLEENNYLKVLVTDDLKSCFRKYELEDTLTEDDIDIITSIVIAKFSLEDKRDEVKNIIRTYYGVFNNQSED